MVKFGMIAGAGNDVIFNRICSWRARTVASLPRRVAVCVFWVGSWSERSRIMLGTVSDRSRIGNDVSPVFNFCQMLCAHFAWQAQYLVRLEVDACCSAHCK